MNTVSQEFDIDNLSEDMEVEDEEEEMERKPQLPKKKVKYFDRK